MLLLGVATDHLDFQDADEEGEGEALGDEGEEDDDEGDEDDGVASGKRGAGGGDEGEGEGGGEGIDAAHAGPADDGEVAPIWVRVAGANLAEEEAGDVGGGEDPEEADDDGGGADGGGVEEEVAEGAVLEAFHDLGQLEADEDEDDAVEEVDEHAPEGGEFEPGAGGDHARKAPAEEDAGGDDGEGAGAAEAFGGEVGEEGGEEGDGDLDGGIVEAALDPIDGDADEAADGGAAEGDEGQLKAAVEAEKVPVTTAAMPKR